VGTLTAWQFYPLKSIRYPLNAGLVGMDVLGQKNLLPLLDTEPRIGQLMA